LAGRRDYESLADYESLVGAVVDERGNTAEHKALIIEEAESDYLASPTVLVDLSLLARLARYRAGTLIKGFCLKTLPVILDVLLHCSVTPARIKIVILPFLDKPCHNPILVTESMHRSNDTSPMTATC
jgi:hypothetical protein